MRDILHPLRPDTAGPRYTSYPTADRFGGHVGPEAHQHAMAGRSPGPLSVYVHLPFCESVCYYCACNKVVTRRHERVAPYLAALATEAALVQEALGGHQPLSQLHLGGGTPTFLDDDELTALMALLRRSFVPVEDAEISIEVDPRTADPARLGHLRELGFNRLSFGVQDFDPDVQQAVHRVQSHASVERLVRAARELGFASTNVDLIHGLPRQTPASFDRTLAQVTALRPDRIALYSYAHLPERFKPQRRIVPADLPAPDDRLSMWHAANETFARHGYDLIGMDHYALAGDSLAVARREGRLHRNFQGYSTRPDCDLVGLGVSAIGRIGDTYVQNARTLPEYEAALARGRLPTVRGHTLDDDDRLRRDTIMALMCRGRIDVAALELRHGVKFEEHFAHELAGLSSFEAAGLVVRHPRSMVVTAAGWQVVRAIAMVFDRYQHLPHRVTPSSLRS